MTDVCFTCVLILVQCVSKNITSVPQSEYVYDIADLTFVSSLGNDSARDTMEMPVSSAIVSVAGILLV